MRQYIINSVDYNDAGITILIDLEDTESILEDHSKCIEVHGPANHWDTAYRRAELICEVLTKEEEE
jgi:hypothetical protein